MRKFLSRYTPSYVSNVIYMLQATNYKLVDYFAWLRRTKDFGKVAHRGSLERTEKSLKLLTLAWIILAALILLSGCLMVFGFIKSSPTFFALAVLLAIISPWALAYLITVPLVLGNVLVQRPKEKKIIARAASVLANHRGKKIAIVGSYGKTTAKEIIATVLSEGKKVAFTPGNMNTPIGISRFAQKLKGNEDILIFEMGEERVGDIKKLCDLVGPEMGVITGVSEAHLSSFGTIENVVKTIFELSDFLGNKVVYKNGESKVLNDYIDNGDSFRYDRDGVNGWHVKSVSSSMEGLGFTAFKDGHTLKLKSKIIGPHNIGIILAAVDIASTIGMSDEQIIKGVAKTKPFEHRLEPKMVHGAWIIDDTYNGNSEGVSAGLDFLRSLEANRKIYVTPGLVEQGDKKSEIHNAIGWQIATAADYVVLFKNSTTDYILKGLKDGGYKGELRIIDDPLSFYSNLDHFVAAGDVVLMQNDWTDNYA